MIFITVSKDAATYGTVNVASAKLMSWNRLASASGIREGQY